MPFRRDRSKNMGGNLREMLTEGKGKSEKQYSRNFGSKCHLLRHLGYLISEFFRPFQKILNVKMRTPLRTDCNSHSVSR